MNGATPWPSAASTRRSPAKARPGTLPAGGGRRCRRPRLRRLDLNVPGDDGRHRLSVHARDRGAGRADRFVWARPQPPRPKPRLPSRRRRSPRSRRGPMGGSPISTASQPTTGLVLYTGGKVPPAALAPAARAIVEQGFLVAIVPAPLNFAIFDTNAAGAVIADRPQVAAWPSAGTRSVVRRRPSSSTAIRGGSTGSRCGHRIRRGSSTTISPSSACMVAGRRSSVVHGSGERREARRERGDRRDRRRQPRADGVVHGPAE